MVSEPPRWFTYAAAAGIGESNRRSHSTTPDARSPLQSSPFNPQRIISTQSSNNVVAGSPIRSVTSTIPQRNLSSEKQNSVAVPQRKEVAPLFPSRSPFLAKSIAVPQWNLFTQMNYHPEDLEKLDLKTDQSSDSATKAVSLVPKRLQEFTREAAKCSRELTIGGSAKMSNVVLEASERSKGIAVEASERSKEIVAEQITSTVVVSFDPKFRRETEKSMAGVGAEETALLETELKDAVSLSRRRLRANAAAGEETAPGVEPHELKGNNTFENQHGAVIVDVCGINTVSRVVLSNAGAAFSGMVVARLQTSKQSPTVDDKVTVSSDELGQMAVDTKQEACSKDENQAVNTSPKSVTSSGVKGGKSKSQTNSAESLDQIPDNTDKETEKLPDSQILDSVKKENEEIKPIGKRLAESVVVNCASKLKPYITHAVKSLGISLDEYSEVLSFILQGTPVAAEHNNDTLKELSFAVESLKSEEIPCISAVVVALLAEPKPRIDYVLKAVGGSLTAIPGLSDMIDDTVESIVTDVLQWPHRIVVPIGGIPVDTSDLELKPQGKLTVTIIKASDLKNQEMIGKSDPYVVVFVRPLFKVKTKTIDNNLNRVWNEIFKLIAKDKETQSLIIEKPRFAVAVLTTFCV